MTPPTPVLVVAAARALVGVRSRLSATAFIHYVGFVAHLDDYTGASDWLLASAEDPDDLWRQAQARGIGSTARPEPGELFLLWSEKQRAFTHAGIVAARVHWGRHDDGARYYRCVTIEGNANPSGTTGAGGVSKLVRNLSSDRGDRFIRWVDLDGRRSIGQIAGADPCAALMASARKAA